MQFIPLALILLVARLLVEQAASREVTLTWQPPSKILTSSRGGVIKAFDPYIFGYRVFVYTTDPEAYGLRSAPVAQYEVNGCRYTVKHLQRDKTYWFTVRSINRYGLESENCAAITYTVPQ